MLTRNIIKHQVLKCIFVRKKSKLEYSLPNRFFVVVFYRKNLKLIIITLLPIKWFWGRYFCGNTFYETKLLKRISFRINFCTTRQFLNPDFSNTSGFEPTFCSSSKFDSRFLERVRFWIIFFTTRRSSTRINYNAADFGVKLILANQILFETFLSKNLFWIASKR